MITRRELMDWLYAVPDSDRLAIDEGGLTLFSLDEPGLYIEIGGVPLDPLPAPETA